MQNTLGSCESVSQRSVWKTLCASNLPLVHHTTFIQCSDDKMNLRSATDETGQDTTAKARNKLTAVKQKTMMTTRLTMM